MNLVVNHDYCALLVDGLELPVACAPTNCSSCRGIARERSSSSVGTRTIASASRLPCAKRCNFSTSALVRQLLDQSSPVCCVHPTSEGRPPGNQFPTHAIAAAKKKPNPHAS